MRERDFVLGVDLLMDDDFADIIELVPIFVSVHIPVKRLELGPARNGHIQSFRSEEGILIKEVTCIAVRLVGEESAADSIEIDHDWKRK